MLLVLLGYTFPTADVICEWSLTAPPWNIPDFAHGVGALLEGQPPGGPVEVPEPQVVLVGASPEHLAGLFCLGGTMQQEIAILNDFSIEHFRATQH